MAKQEEKAVNLGREAEALVLKDLLERGWHLKKTNYRIRGGEIDLIMEDPTGVLVFIEVKARSSQSFGTPAEAVNAAKRRRLKLAALWYLQETGQQEASCRFDVAEALLQEGKTTVRYLENAFE